MRLTPLALMLVAACDYTPLPLDFEGEDRPPSVLITLPADQTLVLPGTALHLQANVVDPDGARDVVEVQVTSSLSGRVDPGGIRPDSEDLIDLDLRLSEGTHVLTVTATDRATISASASVTVQVGGFDPAPVVTVTVPQQGATAYQGQRLALQATAVDARYAASALTWRWTATESLGAVEVVGSATVYPDNTIRPLWYPRDKGTWTLELVVTNPDGLSGVVERVLTVGDPSVEDLDGDGQSPADGDCDDEDPNAYLGAPELPNGLDDDCDGVADEGTDLYDNDGDGYCGNPTGCTDPLQQPGDCDDTTRAVSPLMREVCGNDLDDDCDGNQNTPDAVGCTNYWTDLDHDGWGTAAQGSRCLCGPEGLWTALATEDCAPSNPNIYPTAPELPNDVDDDCDQQIDEETDRVDLDGDGYCANPTSCVLPQWKPGDCNDQDIHIRPGIKENCATAYDDNCNSLVNERDGTNCTLFWGDRDGDGWGKTGDYQCWCQATTPYSALSPRVTDCDDQDARVYPGQTTYFATPTLGDGGYDYNCNTVVERSEPYQGYECTFDVLSLFCRVIVEGFVGGPPACGVTRPWAEDCSAGVFSCEASHGVSRTMKCR